MNRSKKTGFSAALCVLLSTLNVAAQEDIRPAIHLGFQAQDVQQSVESDPLLYPNFSFSMEHTYFDLQMESMMLVVLADGIISVIKYLAGGSDKIILFEALNPRDPARIPLFDFRGRYNFYQKDRLTIGAGPGIEYALHTYYAPERDNFTAFNADVNVALRVNWDDTDLLWMAKVGNGWTDYASLNPLIGTTFRVRQRMYGPLWVYGRANYGTQRFDNSGWTEPFINSGVDPEQARFVEWVQLYGGEVGIALVFD